MWTGKSAGRPDETLHKKLIVSYKEGVFLRARRSGVSSYGGQILVTFLTCSKKLTKVKGAITLKFNKLS